MVSPEQGRGTESLPFPLPFFLITQPCLSLFFRDIWVTIFSWLLNVYWYKTNR